MLFTQGLSSQNTKKILLKKKNGYEVSQSKAITGGSYDPHGPKFTKKKKDLILDYFYFWKFMMFPRGHILLIK